MQKQLKPEESLVFWVVGALERIATLGFLDSDIPWKIPADRVATWQEIDENRFQRFTERVVEAVARGIVGSGEDSVYIVDLVLEFYSDKGRYKITKIALEHSLNGH